MNIWKLICGISVWLLAGCGTVTSVHGWAGGHVVAAVEDGQAVVEYQAPGKGWTLTVDRAKVDGGTAKLWITAHSGPIGGRANTPIVATWNPKGAQIDCTQAYVRVERSGQDAGDYLPAAIGCGPRGN
jgi:hypothetical protein